MTKEAPSLSAIVQPLFGLPCWNVTWERHTNLGLYFGTPRLVVREPRQTTAASHDLQVIYRYRHIVIRGDWFFWIFASYWKLTLAGAPSVTGASAYRPMQHALTLLDGQYITTFTVNPANGQTTITFDLGATLVLRRMEKTGDMIMWSVYTPADTVLSIRGDGQMSYQPSDQPDVWAPMTSIQG